MLLCELWVKGLDIPPHDTYPARQSVIFDASLDNANRIIFSPWDTLPGYEEQATEIIDISEMDVVIDADYRKQKESTTRLPPRLEQFASKNISMEEEKSNKSSSFSQLVMRVQPSHFYKGHLNVTCVARILSVWFASGAILLDEERPQIAPVMGSRDTSDGTRPTSQIALTLLNYLLFQYWSKL